MAKKQEEGIYTLTVPLTYEQRDKLRKDAEAEARSLCNYVRYKLGLV